MTKDEALIMAIKVMQAFDNQLPTNSAKHAIQACKEALEQPVCSKCGKPTQQGECFYGCRKEQPTQEPKCSNHPDAPHGFCRDASHSAGRYVCECEEWEAEQPTQEPVAWNEEEFNAIAYAYRTCSAHEVKMVSDRYQELVNYVLSITHPAPSWQGLSDDEIKLLCNVVIEIQSNDVIEYEWNEIEKIALSIESKLKEKNEK